MSLGAAFAGVGRRWHSICLLLGRLMTRLLPMVRIRWVNGRRRLFEIVSTRRSGSGWLMNLCRFIWFHPNVLSSLTRLLLMAS